MTHKKSVFFMMAAALLLTTTATSVQAQAPAQGEMPSTTQPVVPAKPGMPETSPSVQPQQGQTGTTSSTTAADPAIPDWMEYKNPYTAEQDNLTNPHRTPEEITMWAEQIAVEALSMSNENSNERLTEIKKVFAPSGWKDYVTYLQKSQLINMIRQQDYDAMTIVDGSGFIAQKASTGGAYRWLVEVPVVTSLTRPDPQTGQPGAARSARLRIIIQIGRVKQGGDDNDIAIESWTVKNRTN